MFHSIEKQISERVLQYVRTKYSTEGFLAASYLERASALEQPKQSSFGELAINDSPIVAHAPRLQGIRVGMIGGGCQNRHAI